MPFLMHRPYQHRTNSKHIDMEQIRIRHGLDMGRVLFRSTSFADICPVCLLFLWGTILNLYIGFHEVDEEKIKLIQTLGGNKSQALFKVILPANRANLIGLMKSNIDRKSVV